MMGDTQNRAVGPASNTIAIKRSLEQMATQFRDALPSHITPEKFQRVVLTLVNMSPELARADKTSLLSACMKCAADGLVPDGRDAALVVFGGKVQYMPMYAGLMRRARNSGDISSISAHVVYEKDRFTYQLGDEEAIEHKPAMEIDRGKMIAVYAIARFKDGSIQREVLTAAEVERVRKASRSGNSGPWQQWPDQMWRKTAIRRLSKYLPLDADMDRLMARGVDPEHADAPTGEVLDHAPAGVDPFEAASEGVLITQDVTGEVLPPEVRPMDLEIYIAGIELCETEAQLMQTQQDPIRREWARQASKDDLARVEMAIKAQRALFARGAVKDDFPGTVTRTAA